MFLESFFAFTFVEDITQYMLCFRTFTSIHMRAEIVLKRYVFALHCYPGLIRPL
jgi:hypothetical protein